MMFLGNLIAAIGAVRGIVVSKGCAEDGMRNVGIIANIDDSDARRHFEAQARWDRLQYYPIAMDMLGVCITRILNADIRDEDTEYVLQAYGSKHSLKVTINLDSSPLLIPTSED